MNAERMLGVLLIGIMATLAGVYLALNNQSPTILAEEPPQNNTEPDLTMEKIIVNPSIDVNKMVSIDGVTFYEADTTAELLEVDHLLGLTTIYYKIIVTNIGDVPLTLITLIDPGMDLSGCEIPEALETGESFECIIGPLNTEEGLISNTVTATANYSDIEVTDEDQAHYEGITSKVKIIKDCDPDNETEFSFKDPELKTFVLIDDGVDTSLANKEFILLPGTYVFEEIYVEGWTLDSISITGDDDGGSVKDESTGITTIDLDRGESITVTYTNIETIIPVLDIDVEKFVSDSISGPWHDADIESSAFRFNGIDDLYWKVNVTNNGNVPLDLSWEDELDESNLDLASILGSNLPSTLEPGEAAEFTITSTTEFGMHRNHVMVNGSYMDETITDEDSAHYYIGVYYTEPPDFVIPETPLGTLTVTLTMLTILALLRKSQIRPLR
jgi:hypothetical protein